MSVDGKQHLSEVVFSALIGFSLLEKSPTFGQRKKKQAYLERWKLNYHQSMFFCQKKSESSARNVLEHCHDGGAN